MIFSCKSPLLAAIALLSTSSSSCACVDNRQGNGSNAPQAITAAIADTLQPKVGKPNPVVNDFFRRVKRDRTPDEVGRSARRYVSSLGPADQLEVARAAADNPDSTVSAYGLNLLVRLGYEDETISRFALRMAQGDPLEGFAYSWLHSGDDPLLPRMIFKLAFWLLDHLDSLNPDEQATARLILCEMVSADCVTSFSREYVAKRLRELAEQINHKPDGPLSNNDHRKR